MTKRLRIRLPEARWQEAFGANPRLTESIALSGFAERTRKRSSLKTRYVPESIRYVPQRIAA